MSGELTRKGVRGEGMDELIVAVMAQRKEKKKTHSALVTREHKTNRLRG